MIPEQISSTVRILNGDSLSCDCFIACFYRVCIVIMCVTYKNNDKTLQPAAYELVKL